MFAVPADPARGVAVAAAMVRAERLLRAPVVRHAELAPGGIVEARLLRPGRIGFEEAPIGIK